MKRALVGLLVVLLAIPASLGAFSKKEKVLWIETREHGEKKATIAVSVMLAQHLLDENEKEDKVHFDRNLITREMIDDVLSGRKESVESSDPKSGESARLWLGKLEIKAAEDDDAGDLVIEVFKKGKRSFTLRLPAGHESEERDDDDADITSMTFGWDSLMPFMAETKGVVYVFDHDDETEFWMYVD